MNSPPDYKTCVTEAPNNINANSTNNGYSNPSYNHEPSFSNNNQQDTKLPQYNPNNSQNQYNLNYPQTQYIPNYPQNQNNPYLPQHSFSLQPQYPYIPQANNQVGPMPRQILFLKPGDQVNYNPNNDQIIFSQTGPPQTPLPYVDFTAAIIMSCFVIWCCGCIFGLIAFILAVIGQSNYKSGGESDARARNYLKASYTLSIVGIVAPIILVTLLVSIGTSVGFGSRSAYGSSSGTNNYGYSCFGAYCRGCRC